ncbi:MerR family transcriptional regulator [Actinomyces glycerinitolerans]|uniref:HTH merR-type domain-containing protein n=1 Tax=Actinomyces glycerinitolerans TaxID=1892869 RepID=A0A1M4RXT0_9ACTO|nr:MerR family transcriptional regulator [Actinomyces glycerinitolerans]SHE24766.1 Hypothetical protein ACGLYG10_0975 [Actinomyces glycerinitolerans]
MRQDDLSRDLIKVSEMAALHGVSRQTLILYDRNGLLKPAHVSDTGYRYYSIDQVPRLRLICLLKAMGVPLARIKAYLDDRSVEGIRGLLRERAAQIEEEIVRLRLQWEDIARLDDIFATATASEKNVDTPHVRTLPQRRALFAPYPAEGDADLKRLHLALMDAWGRLLDAGAIPSRGFGFLLDAAALAGDRPLAGAGSLIILPREIPLDDAEFVTLPAGEYACMYKYSMPYDVEPARELLSWMSDRGMQAAGPVVDRCLLDTVFHTEEHDADFCRLEILLA